MEHEARAVCRAVIDPASSSGLCTKYYLKQASADDLCLHVANDGFSLLHDDDLALHIDCAARPLPPIFGWLRDQGTMDLQELARTFNCGIGLLIFVDNNKSDDVLSALHNGPELDAWIAGKLANRNAENAVLLDQSDSWMGL